MVRRIVCASVELLYDIVIVRCREEVFDASIDSCHAMHLFL
jgi:hypothetical protein